MKIIKVEHSRSKSQKCMRPHRILKVMRSQSLKRSHIRSRLHKHKKLQVRIKVIRSQTLSKEKRGHKKSHNRPRSLKHRRS